jgi:hypothetical protein
VRPEAGYDLGATWPGIVVHHSETCPARLGRPCICGPLGFRATFEDPQHHESVLGPVVPTLDDAHAWQREQSVAMDAYRAAAMPGESVADVVDEFLEAARAGEVADARGVAYSGDDLRDLRWSLRGYVASEIGPMSITQLRRPDLRAFISRLDAAGLAPARTRAVVTALRALLRYAADRGMVPRSAADPLMFGDTDDLPTTPRTVTRIEPAPGTWPQTAPPPAAWTQTHQAPEWTQNHQGPEWTQTHQAPEWSQNHQAPAGWPQNHQAPAGWPQTPPGPPMGTETTHAMTMGAQSPAPAPPSGFVSDEVIWMILKIVALIFALIALVLVAESV